MISKLKELLCRIKVCLVCGYFGRLDEFGLCHWCSTQLISAFTDGLMSANSNNEFNHKFLMLLGRSGCFSSKLVYVLKGELLKDQVYSQLALRFYHLYYSPKWQYIFIPIPTSKTSLKNCHARQFAKHLSYVFGGEYKDVLVIESDLVQKTRSRSMRKKRVVHAREVPEITEKSKIVLVDDVLTTGASAMASITALKSPVNLEVYTLFWKPLWGEFGCKR